MGVPMGGGLSPLQRAILRMCEGAQGDKFWQGYITINDVIEAYYKTPRRDPGKPRRRGETRVRYFVDYQSTHRNAVSRAMKRLEKRGLVRYRRGKARSIR